MYPVLKEGVSIGTYQYEGSETTHYYIVNADGEEFQISYRLWDSLLHADGTRPLNLPNNGSGVLPMLKQLGLVQTSRFVRGKGVFNRFILCAIGKQSLNNRLICKVINAILPIVSLLVFAIGVYLMKSRGTNTACNFSWWLYYCLFACSIALHEVGHLVAGLAYGYKISDVGILLLGIIPIGAYVAHEDKKDISRAKKLQIALVGVEMNLLIAGVCLMVALQNYSLSTVLTWVANANVLLAIINLLPASSLDGESALSAVFGVNSISEAARRWLTDKNRQKLFCSGLPGFLCFCLFSITLISRALFWMLIGLNIISVVFFIF